jgi:hypothetical protein
MTKHLKKGWIRISSWIMLLVTGVTMLMEPRKDVQNVAEKFLLNEGLTSCSVQAMNARRMSGSRGYSQYYLKMTGLHLAAMFGLDILFPICLI